MTPNVALTHHDRHHEQFKSLKEEYAKAQATTTRLKALVERWRSRYGISRDGAADELEAALTPAPEEGSHD